MSTSEFIGAPAASTTLLWAFFRSPSIVARNGSVEAVSPLMTSSSTSRLTASAMSCMTVCFSSAPSILSSSTSSVRSTSALKPLLSSSTDERSGFVRSASARATPGVAGRSKRCPKPMAGNSCF